jgi:hypothetical protein
MYRARLSRLKTMTVYFSLFCKHIVYMSTKKSLKIDDSCIKIRAVGAIVNSNKDLKTKVKLLGIYVPELKDIKVSDEPKFEEEFIVLKIVTGWVKKEGVKCDKFFNKLGINKGDRRVYMDEVLGFHHILDKL